ncbi:MAG: hypothetical protein KGO53_03830 [Alphaproteobacteria bacterium]|nr:hypothetical protein [Alphaproteobacteria bacterium]
MIDLHIASSSALLICVSAGAFTAMRQMLRVHRTAFVKAMNHPAKNAQRDCRIVAVTKKLLKIHLETKLPLYKVLRFDQFAVEGARRHRSLRDGLG